MFAFVVFDLVFRSTLRSTLLSRPNKVGFQMSDRLYLCPPKVSSISMKFSMYVEVDE